MVQHKFGNILQGLILGVMLSLFSMQDSHARVCTVNWEYTDRDKTLKQFEVDSQIGPVPAVNANLCNPMPAKPATVPPPPAGTAANAPAALAYKEFQEKMRKFVGCLRALAAQDEGRSSEFRKKPGVHGKGDWRGKKLGDKAELFEQPMSRCGGTTGQLPGSTERFQLTYLRGLGLQAGDGKQLRCYCLMAKEDYDKRLALARKNPGFDTSADWYAPEGTSYFNPLKTPAENNQNMHFVEHTAGLNGTAYQTYVVMPNGWTGVNPPLGMTKISCPTPPYPTNRVCFY